jgi:hypothetical protein
MQQYAIRAMPAMGFSHRWCAQRPWGKETMVVTVTDSPKPATVEERDGRKHYAYHDEISAADLEELRRDPHISVSIVGSGDGDPLALNAAKARIIELEAKIADARLEHQAETEELKAFRMGALKQVEEMGAKVALLEQQLASANANLAERKRK